MSRNEVIHGSRSGTHRAAVREAARELAGSDQILQLVTPGTAGDAYTVAPIGQVYAQPPDDGLDISWRERMSRASRQPERQNPDHARESEGD